MKQSEIKVGHVYINANRDYYRVVNPQGQIGDGIEHLLLVSNEYIKDNKFICIGIPYHITKKSFAKWAKEDVIEKLSGIEYLKE